MLRNWSVAVIRYLLTVSWCCRHSAASWVVISSPLMRASAKTRANPSYVYPELVRRSIVSFGNQRGFLSHASLHSVNDCLFLSDNCAGRDHLMVTNLLSHKLTIIFKSGLDLRISRFARRQAEDLAYQMIDTHNRVPLEHRFNALVDHFFQIHVYRRLTPSFRCDKNLKSVFAECRFDVCLQFGRSGNLFRPTRYQPRLLIQIVFINAAIRRKLRSTQKFANLSRNPQITLLFHWPISKHVPHLLHRRPPPDTLFAP